MKNAVEKSSFRDRVSKLLERVEYRRADSIADKTAIYRLRHEAYTRDGGAQIRPSGIFDDHYDQDPNAWIMGVYIDGELAGSLRLHVAANIDASLPAKTAFPEVIEPYLRAGACIIDGTRFVSTLAHARRFPELPYIILRLSFVAERFFGADYMTAGCRDEHQAFYKRMFGCKPWAAARPYPYLTRLIALVAFDCKADTDIYSRYPFLCSEPTEQRALFSISSNGARGADWVKHDAVARDERKAGEDLPRYGLGFRSLHPMFGKQL
jgi:hypothetical protein